MRPTRFLPLLLVCLIVFALPGAVPAAQAQGDVRALPYPSVLSAYVLSPDGTTLVTFEQGAIHGDEVLPAYLPLRLIDLATGEERQTFTGHTDYAAAVAFTPDGARLASYHLNGEISVWDVTTGALLNTMRAFPRSGSQITFLPDSQTLVTTHYTASIAHLLLWDIDAGALSGMFSHHFVTSEDFMDSVQDYRYSAINLLVSPDGAALYTVTSTGHIWRWDIASGEPSLARDSELALPNFPMRQAAFLPGGTALFYYDAEREDFFTLDLLSGAETALGYGAASLVFALAPDGDTLVWLNRDDDTLHMTRLSNPADSAALTLALGELQARSTGQLPHPALQFTPDGAQLVIGGLAALDTGDNALFVVDVMPGAAAADDK